MLPALAVFVVLAGSFGLTFVLMRGLQRLGCFDDPIIPGLRPAPIMRPIALPLGPDDDTAFLRELRRRIDLGHFRH